MDIVVKELNAMDQISIRTQNSEYQFQLINPAQCRGFLSGGLFGKERYEAFLTGAMVAENRAGRISAKLETGTCALFYISIKQTLRLLTTSVITDLTLAH
jgi:hypothetical protein